jgi:hypothetical protein
MNEKERLQQWATAWQTASEKLEELRIKEIRNADTQQAILNLDSAFLSALKLKPLRLSTGLIEFRRILEKRYKND